MANEDLLRLVETSGFVFRGKAVEHPIPEAEVGAGAANKAVAVAVEEVMRGTDVLRGLKGRDVIVISEHVAAIETAGECVFFTECISLGAQVVARELAHRQAAPATLREITEAISAAAERPLIERVRGAELIVTGHVSSVRVLEKPFPPKSEHDPHWAVARVAVRTVIKGRKPRGDIEVLFASSDDIAWRRSPRLHEGSSGIFILRVMREHDEPRELPRSVYVAIDPLDFLPEDRLGEVRRGLDSEPGGR